LSAHFQLTTPEHAMTGSPSPAAIGSPYTAIAHQAQRPYSKIHKDGVPQKLGFRGPLVVGLVVYGNMARALVSRFGEAWLGKVSIDVKFLKPVYDGDRLRIEVAPIAGRAHERAFEVTAFNESGNDEVSARLETWSPAELPAVEPHAALKPIEWEGEKPERTWERLVEGQPFRSLAYTPTFEDNAQWSRVIENELPLYQQGERPPLHPIQVLRHVQMATAHQFSSGAGMHSSTRAVVRRLMRVGDPIHVLTVPVAKWEKKGNQWTTLYAAVRTGDEVCAEMFHTQIFKLRGSEGA
jgi:hypothetical protein